MALNYYHESARNGQVRCARLTGNATLEVAISAVNHGHVQRILCKPVAAVTLIRAITPAFAKRLEGVFPKRSYNAASSSK